jgi:hypothetical protein
MRHGRRFSARRQSAWRPPARRSSAVARAGRHIAVLVLLVALGIPTAAIAATMPATPQTPGPASPLQTPPAVNNAPPDISNQAPHNGVITPPAGISRMPVIKPRVLTNTPVIPPAGSTGGSQKVVPK